MDNWVKIFPKVHFQFQGENSQSEKIDIKMNRLLDEKRKYVGVKATNIIFCCCAKTNWYQIKRARKANCSCLFVYRMRNKRGNTVYHSMDYLLLKSSISSHSKPRMMGCTRFLNCFVLQHCVIKTKHSRSLIRGVV